MLDLKKLSEKVIRAIEEETTDSLNAWLTSKRNGNLLHYVGEGEYLEKFESCNMVFTFEEHTINIHYPEHNDENNSISEFYSSAA